MGDAMMGRWLREATETEVKRFLRADGNGVIEWPMMGKSFIGHKQRLMIVRTGILGGDVRVIDGGWVYANQIAFLLDWSDIAYVGNQVRGYRPM